KHLLMVSPPLIDFGLSPVPDAQSDLTPVGEGLGIGNTGVCYSLLFIAKLGFEGQTMPQQARVRLSGIFL
ncbi:MAG: hypothetical protein ACKO4R_08550, partial [Synechococcales cyanobacterium]